MLPRRVEADSQASCGYGARERGMGLVAGSAIAGVSIGLALRGRASRVRELVHCEEFRTRSTTNSGSGADRTNGGKPRNLNCDCPWIETRAAASTTYFPRLYACSSCDRCAVAVALHGDCTLRRTPVRSRDWCSGTSDDAVDRASSGRSVTRAGNPQHLPGPGLALESAPRWFAAGRGDVAQLGERRVRNAKVGSSILLVSTRIEDAGFLPGSRPAGSGSPLVIASPDV